MFFELIELTCATISSGVVGVVGYKLGKKKGIKEAPKIDLEKELKEVEEFLHPYDKENKENGDKKEDKVEAPKISNYVGRIPFAGKATTSLYNKKEQWYWVCPKCSLLNERIGKRYMPQFCHCDGTEHYHFLCNTCGFKAIMEPADKKK
jgi:rubrerythrin